MDHPVEFAVVVPYSGRALNYDPLQPYDDQYFDRTVDKILSEEPGLEESRQRLEDVNIQSGLEDDTLSESTVRSTSDSLVGDRSVSRSTPPASSAPAEDWVPDYEDERIFASVGPEKRLEILTIISKSPFMLNCPARTSERIEFTRQVNDLARDAGIQQTEADALIEFVRQTYFWEHGITRTESNATTFGDEINDLEVPTQHLNASKKRRHSEGTPLTSKRVEASSTHSAAMSTPAAQRTPKVSSTGAKKAKKVACDDCRRRKVL